MTREEAKKKITSNWYFVIDKIFDDFESRDKELTSRLDNAKKRYESKCKELDDCSAFSTKQALKINDFESRRCENCTWNEKDYEEKSYCTYMELPNMEYCSKFERIGL